MAHLLEHMNFIKSTHDRNIKKELEDHGARWNGTTDYDRTNYFETVNASDENLQWALGLEAERMVNMRIEKPLLDTEMTVVRNEFERGENNVRQRARRARTFDGVPLAQLRQVDNRFARRYRTRADRSPCGVLPQVLPAGQRRADDCRPDRSIENAAIVAVRSARFHGPRGSWTNLYGRAAAGRRTHGGTASRGQRQEFDHRLSCARPWRIRTPLHSK